MAKTRRNYTGGAVSTTTSSSIAASGTTSFTVSAYTGWPYGSAPFFVVLEPGTANEEKILVTRSGSSDSTLSVYATPNVAANRGLDGTVAVSHSNGSVIYPVFTAQDADEANEMAATLTTKGDLLTHGASTFARVGVGTDTHVLVADSAQSAGIKWGQVQTAGIADDAVTAAKIAAGAVGSSEIGSSAVTSDELADNAVTTAKITDLNVTTAKIADAAITSAKLATSSVVTASITDANVTAGKLASNSVETAKIANGAVTAEKIADATITSAKMASGVLASAVPTGSVNAYAGASAPSGWLLCDGTAVSRTTYASLFAVLGTTYGAGNGSSTFNLPDLRSKFVAGKGTATWSDTLAETGGSKNAIVPYHTHTHEMFGGVSNDSASFYVYKFAGLGYSGLAATGYSGTTSDRVSLGSGSPDFPGANHTHGLTIDHVGTEGNTVDANLPPYVTLNYIIKT